MNTIQAELELAKQKMFRDYTYNGHTLVELTRDNVALAEAMYRSDSANSRALDIFAAPAFDQKGRM